MRVLNFQFVIDSGDEKMDEKLYDSILGTVKLQKKMIPTDKVKLLIGEEIKS